jgi:signal transduction histidine kinase
MASFSRTEFKRILDEVLPEDKADQESRSIQCLGLSLSAGPISLGRARLFNGSLPRREKSNLEDLARELLSAPEAVEELKTTGKLEIDTRDPGDPSSEQLTHRRLFYAVESRLEFAEFEPHTVRLRGWAFASERPSTHFSPLPLRSRFDLLESTVLGLFLPPSRRSITLALRGGAFRTALAAIASIHEPIDGMVLWLYDEILGRYLGVASLNAGKTPFDVPINRSHVETHRGLVSQVMPDRRSVVYDTQDQNLWRPQLKGAWEPFDVGLFRQRGWRSCMAIPIVSAGRLVGALSAYSKRSADSLIAIESELAEEAAICADAILNRRDQAVIADLESRYESELLTANVSLSALSLSHDISHYFRSVEKSIEQAKGFLETAQYDEVGKYLELMGTTMKGTKPAIGAMLRLSNEARGPGKGEQTTPDPVQLLDELEALLKSILPHFTKGERLKSEAVEVAHAGEPREVKVGRLTLERIIVNLCVNSAQWNAKGVWVTGHFDRGDDFQLVVRDDGVGIPTGGRDRAFDRFYSARKGGSGLGLYVVKKLATQAGGDVFLQSYHRTDASNDTGTVVTVVLPTSRSDG